MKAQGRKFPLLEFPRRNDFTDCKILLVLSQQFLIKVDDLTAKVKFVFSLLLILEIGSNKLFPSHKKRKLLLVRVNGFFSTLPWTVSI